MGKTLLFIRKRTNGLSPPIVVFISFVIVILVGTILLTLPISSEALEPTSFIDALFTSTSATCVTGLIVFDTAEHWSWFGEIVILFLIQIGGLGLITIMTFFMTVMRRNSTLKSMLLAQESLNTFDWQNSVSLIRGVVIVVLGVELTGAVLLSYAFVPEYGLKGVYYGIFHSISAFCNSGFDVFGGLQSMTGFSGNPMVLYTVCGLIMVGGLGFIVWQDIWSFRKTHALRLHTKLVLTISAVLWVFGALLIYIIERPNANTLGALPTREAVDAAIFLSVNARTAGFNSINLNAMNDVSKMNTSILMFIGAASGSTGGGIKVNTLGIIMIGVFSTFQPNRQIVFRKRMISEFTVMKAFTVISLSGIWLIIATMAISLINPEFRLINSLFETASAFGTVGLSVGITTSPYYGTISKIIHILTMFIGRVGPMTFAIVLTIRRKHRSDIVYPEGKMIVG